MSRYYFLRQDLFSCLDTIDVYGHTEATAMFDWVDGVRFSSAVPLEVL